MNATAAARIALAPHPAAEAFPALLPAEFAELKADIAARGLLQAIWLYEGQILDGRNRYRACQELGIEPTFRTYEGTTPIEFAWSLNGLRRHLTSSQRAAIAVKLLEPLKVEAKKRQEAGVNQYTKSLPPHLAEGSAASGEAAAHAARIAGVSRSYVNDAKSVAARDPELFGRVQRGELSVNKAHQIVKERATPRIDGRKPRAERIEEIRALASQGHRATQIAETLGIQDQQVRKIARDEGITLPDAAIGKVRLVNARRSSGPSRPTG
jgi:hypothetical protein